MYHYLQQLSTGKNLSRHTIYSLFTQLKFYPVPFQTEFLRLLTKKQESIEEILGAMDAMIQHSVAIDYPHEVVDIVGTGGDKHDTFNISTASSIVIASCGVKVAKHGGRSVSSRAGSTDVLEAIGMPLIQTPQDCIKQLNLKGYAYLPAPVFNPQLKQFANIRKQLKAPTIFNILGPLLNPIALTRPVIGVYRRDLVVKIANVLKTKGIQHAIVVHAEDGLDEFSLNAQSHIAILRNNQLSESRITPEDIGLNRANLSEIKGGDAADNAAILRGIFLGKITGAKLDVVLLNSAAGLLVANRVATLHEGVLLAKQAISSGRVATFFNQLSEDGREHG